MTDSESDHLTLATGGYDHTIKLWQAHTGICIRTMQHPDSQVNALEITPGRTMLAACGYQQIRLYDMISNNPIVNFDGVTRNISSVGFEETGKWMFTGGEDHYVRIWDMTSNNPVCKRMFDCMAPINSVCLHPNQVEMAIGAQNGGVYLWDVKSDAHEQLIPEVDASVQSIAISPNGLLMAAVNNKGKCYIWSLNSTSSSKLSVLQPKHKLDAHKKYGLKCKFSPDSNLLLTTSADGTAKLWNTSDFTLHRELRIDTKRWIWDGSFSADSQYLFTASSDGLARLWNISKSEIDREYIGHQRAITALAFRDEVVT
ncbi:Protein LST8 homolog [Sergentomyia squamirostris]